MKTIHQLIFKTDDGLENDLLFASKRTAENELKKFYYVGSQHPFGKILNSYVIERKLF